MARRSRRNRLVFHSRQHSLQARRTSTQARAPAAACLTALRQTHSIRSRTQDARELDAMAHATQMSAADTGLLVIDVQEKLLPLIVDAPAMVRNIAFLIDAAHLL